MDWWPQWRARGECGAGRGESGSDGGQGQGAVRSCGGSCSSLRSGRDRCSGRKDCSTGQSGSALSPKVWRILYIRAQGLIQQAGLYLLAFGPLRGVFTVGELAGFVDIMAERGLRVRRGLDEYGWDGEGLRGDER